MSTNKSNKKGDSKNGFTIGKVLKILLLSLIIVFICGGLVLGGITLSIIKDVPEIDPNTIVASLDQTSTIYDDNGELLEKIQTLEYRTIVGLDKIPQNLQNAFIAIEDERFLKHPGVDIIGIMSSLKDNLIAGHTVRGASTITQQLARNVYLPDTATEQSLDRKIKEAYLALQIESILSKDQVMEAYLNTIYLGQGAYGVAEASQTYFSKDVEELTLAECALFAGIVKSTTNYQPFKRIFPADYNANEMTLLGQTDVLGQTMYLVYNSKSVDRQKIVLDQMEKVGFITTDEKNEALNENIETSLKPGQRKHHSLTSYFVDYVKTQATEALAEHYGIKESEAQAKLFTGGYKIYSTIDVEMQTKLETIYEDFSNIAKSIAGSPTRHPLLVGWALDKSGNVVDKENANRIIYYNKGNLFNENFDLLLPSSNYEVNDQGLVLKSSIFRAAKDKIMIADCYGVNQDNNMVVYSVAPIGIGENQFTKNDEEGSITISTSFLKDNPEFYTIDENGVLHIPEQYARIESGIVQPQSATVVMDHSTGEIKALVGGRDVSGTMILNRATTSKRQPGSAIKPVSLYYPLVAEGYGAGETVDDAPGMYGGKAWPRNDYGRYHGLIGFRKALEVSSNAGAVNALDKLGVDKSMDYLAKMGMYNPDEPSKSSIVAADPKNPDAPNDENPSALSLGGMTKGVTPLEITAAFATMANDGEYIKPRAFTKIVDSNDNIIVENKPKTTEVSTPQAAYIMKDMLKSVTDNGAYAKRAKLSNGMITSGKTGTTQDQADVWFVGFTPYYTIGTWIGNDSPKITLDTPSKTAASFWKLIGDTIHEDLEPIKEFVEPDGIVKVKVCSKSGKLPSGSCSTITEIYEEGKVPTEKCDQHVYATVCSVSGKQASKYCPDSLLESRLFFKRIPEYIGSEHGNVYPEDYSANPPTGTCDVHTKDAYDEYQEAIRNFFGRPLSRDND